METIRTALGMCQTHEEIRRIYRAGLLRLHPDKNPEYRKEAAAIALSSFLAEVDAAHLRVSSAPAAAGDDDDDAGTGSPMSVD